MSVREPLNYHPGEKQAPKQESEICLEINKWMTDVLQRLDALPEDRDIDRTDHLARLKSRDFCSICAAVPENLVVPRFISTLGSQAYEWEVGGLWKANQRTLEIVKGHGRGRYGRTGFQDAGINKNQWEPLVAKAQRGDLLFHTHPVYDSAKGFLASGQYDRCKSYLSYHQQEVAEMRRIISHIEVEIQNWDILQNNQACQYCLPSSHDLASSLKRRKMYDVDFCEDEIITAEGWNCFITLNRTPAAPEELLAAGPLLSNRELNIVRCGSYLSRTELVRANWSAEQIRRFYQLLGIFARVERVEPYLLP